MGEFDICQYYLTSLSGCEDPPGRSQNIDTNSQSQHAISKINEN